MFAKHQPLHEYLWMYSWKELGQDLLPRFFKSLIRKDGKRYPTGSINNLLNSCQRILRAHQKKVYKQDIEFKVNREPRLNVRVHPFFIRTIDCFSQAMKKSVADGANQPRRKVNIFTMDEERRLLSHPMHQINTPHGLAKRFGFYCCGVFLIRGQTELFGIQLGMFSEIAYDGRPCIRYVKTASKNYKVDLQNFQIEHF